MRLGSTVGQVHGALGDSLLDGLRLCLIGAAVLTLIAALCAVICCAARSRPRAVRRGTGARRSKAARPAPRRGAVAGVRSSEVRSSDGAGSATHRSM